MNDKMKMTEVASDSGQEDSSTDRSMMGSTGFGLGFGDTLLDNKDPKSQSLSSSPSPLLTCFLSSAGLFPSEELANVTAILAAIMASTATSRRRGKQGGRACFD